MDEESMTRSDEHLPSLQKALQQCELVQNMIDISISSLEGLRTKCATSNDLTQKEIRTLEVSKGKCAQMCGNWKVQWGLRILEVLMKVVEKGPVVDMRVETSGTCAFYMLLLQTALCNAGFVAVGCQFVFSERMGFWDN